MKKTVLLFVYIFVFMFAASGAHGQITEDETAGKAILEKLQRKEVVCANLTDNDFNLLGDYYMGEMMGSSHETMDKLMVERMGEQNERLMHMAMGKRFSGCDTSASFPSQGVGFLPMMGMMGGWSSPSNYQPNSFNSMMGNYFGGYPTMGYGGFGWLPMILWWILIIVIVFLLVRWAAGGSRTIEGKHERTALDILKDRYAKGEIEKKEFEEKKKDLSG